MFNLGQWKGTKNEAIAILVSELHSSSVTLSGLVEKYTDIDISKFPPIQASTSFRGILIVSSAVLSPEAAVDLGLDPLASQCGDIKEGLTVVVSVDLPLSSPTIFQIRVTISEAKLCKHNFSSLTLTAFMTAFFPSTLSSLSSFLQFNYLIPLSIQELNPMSVTYDAGQNVVDFDFKVDQVLQLVPGLAQVSVTNFSITVPLDNQRLPSFKSDVDWNLGLFRWHGVSFTIEDDCIQVNWTSDKLSIQDVLQKLNATFLPIKLAAPLRKGGFVDFTIFNPFVRLKVKNDSTNFYLQIGGTTFMTELGHVTVEGIIQHDFSYHLSKARKRRNWVRESTGYPLALGLQIEEISIPRMIERLTGTSASGLASEPFLPTRATVALSVSSLDMDGTRFSYRLLNRLQPIEGISFISEFNFPDCSADSLCRLVQSGSRGDLNIILQGHILSPCRFNLTFSLPTITFKQVTVKNAHLVVNSSGNCTSSLQYSVAIRGNFELLFKEHRLLFEVEIKKTSLTHLQMVAVMRDWYYPFEISWLAIGNGLVQLGFMPHQSTLLTATFDIKIGNFGNGKEIGGRANLGVDIKNQSQGYLCGEISSVTLGSMLKAFDKWPSWLPLHG